VSVLIPSSILSRSENDSNSSLINGTTSDVVQKYVRKEKGTSLRESSLKAGLHSSLSRTEVDGSRRIDPPRVILLSLCRSCLSETEDEKLPRIIDTHLVPWHFSRIHIVYIFYDNSALLRHCYRSWFDIDFSISEIYFFFRNIYLCISIFGFFSTID